MRSKMNACKNHNRPSSIFLILVLSNRCCSTDIKINTALLVIGVVAQIQKLIIHQNLTKIYATSFFLVAFLFLKFYIHFFLFFICLFIYLAIIHISICM